MSLGVIAGIRSLEREQAVDSPVPGTEQNSKILERKRGIGGETGLWEDHMSF